MHLDTIWIDVRYALRVLRRSRTFTATAILTLALGIGAATAVFAVVDAVLLRPLPYADPDRLVGLNSMQRGADGTDTAFVLSEIEIVRWSAATDVISGVEGVQPRSLALTGAGDPEVVRGAAVTSGLFPLLGISPFRGRTFTHDEERGGAPVAVIGHSLWSRRFDGRDDVVGRSVTLDGRSYEIVGVMPPAFRPLLDPSEVWIPLNPVVNPAQQGARMTAAAARLRPGITIEQAERALGIISAALAREFPVSHGDARPQVSPLREQLFGSRRPALVALTAAVIVLLALACANVANLTLGHMTARRSELTVRAIVGAGRTHLVQQQLVEGLLLSAVGASLGSLIVARVLPTLIAMYSSDGQRPIDVAIDWRILAFVIATMVATAVVSSVVPALQVHNSSFSGGYADAATGRVGAGPWEGRIRSVLVAAQIALAIVLLCASGAFLTSLDRLLRTSPGFRADGVLTMQLMLPPVRYPDVAARARFVGRLVDAVAAVPGVVAAGTTQTTFMPNESMQTLLWIDGRSIESGQPDSSNIRHVTPGYFRALVVPVVEGRAIDDRDRIGTSPVCMVSASFARRFWPRESAIGHRVRRTSAAAQWMTVVGVAGDVMDAGAGVSAGPTLYVPYLQVNTATARVTLTARVNGDPLALAGAVQRAIWSVDPLQAADRVSRLDDLMMRSAGDHRFRTALLTMFAAIGLLVALVGVHGVTAAAVESRTREMGVRLALGAEPTLLVRGLVGETTRLLAVGAAAGVIAFLLFGRVLKQLLYETSTVPIGVIGGAILLMSAGAIAAAYLRARPLHRLSPTVAIRGGT